MKKKGDSEVWKIGDSEVWKYNSDKSHKKKVRKRTNVGGWTEDKGEAGSTEARRKD